MNITIYRSATNLGKTTALTNLAGAVNRTIEITGVYAKPVDDFEVVKYPNLTRSFHKEKIQFDVELMPIDFPIIKTNFSEISLSDVLNGVGTLYIDLKDYNIMPDNLVDTEAIRVVWTGRSVDQGTGTKKIKLTFEVM